MFNLNSIKRGKNIRPPRILMYAPHGVGKSSFGAASPSPIFLNIEDGLGTIDTSSFPLTTDYAQVIEAIGSLYTENHDYQTLVVDTADWLEKLVWKETCRIHGKADIEEFGYGKGYGHAVDVWRQVLDGLLSLRDAKNMAVILLAHCKVKRFDSPETEPYDRYMPKMHDGASALIQEWADCVLFANHKTIVQKEDVGFNQKVARGITTGQRVIYTTEKPAYLAKNRYSLPEELPLSWNAFSDAIAASAAPAPAAPAAA